ncbi:degenerin-like protein [Euroglyphus maynei]|uniref:Degenerin-like protein n=1 Tax=Euroglyphus maynei TaxID=6958 RepID=A0A1Y3B6R1_EURMA|nr:degenerin-like protein [Euroglyphus maynei]
MKHIDSLDILYAVGSLIAFLGCVWQLIDVSRIYFAYDTNVNVMFEREIKVEIPGVTICANLGMIANEDYLRENYRSRLESMPEYPERKYRAYKKLLRNLTLDEQLNRATISAKQLFHECRIMTPIAFENSTENIDGFIPCSHVAPIHEFLTYSKKSK